MRSLEVVCGIAMKDGKVFMARRKTGKSLAGFWEFPGGKVEAGEDHKTALARELKEELGVVVEVGDFIASGHTKGEELEINLHGYFIEWDAEPLASSDHDQMGWMGADDFCRLKIPEADMPILKTLLREIHVVMPSP